MLTRGELQSFVRASALCATFAPLLTGLGSVTTRDSPPPVGTLALVVAVGLAFHGFAYVLNDVVDLPLDRTEPRRATSPLVAGRVGRPAALGFALACVPVGLGLSAALGPGGSVAPLAFAYAAMAVYDLWGKRTAVPVVTDLVQGLSWAALLWWGARVTGEPTAATRWLALGSVAFILLANGVHGSLRDLANDARCGARSTALWFGARPLPDGGVVVDRRYAAYAGTLHALVVAASLAAVASEPRLSWPAVAAVLVVAAGATVLAREVWASAADGWRMRRLGLLHLAALLVLPVVAVAPRLDLVTGAVVVVAVGGPIVADAWWPGALRAALATRPRRAS